MNKKKKTTSSAMIGDDAIATLNEKYREMCNLHASLNQAEQDGSNEGIETSLCEIKRAEKAFDEVKDAILSTGAMVRFDWTTGEYFICHKSEFRITVRATSRGYIRIAASSLDEAIYHARELLELGEIDLVEESIEIADTSEPAV